MNPPDPIDVSKLRLALRNPLLLLPEGKDGRPPASMIATENRAFNPPKPNPPRIWLRETLMLNDEPPVATNLIELSGIYRLMVLYPEGSGTEKLEQTAALIAKAYSPVRTINFQGITVTLDKAKRGTGSTTGNSLQDLWFYIPVSIYFRTYYSFR